MVFGWLYLEKKRQEGREEGREQGREEGREQGRQEGRKEGEVVGRAEANAEWDEWNQRRMEAEANGGAFTEPPPSARNGSSGD